MRRSPLSADAPAFVLGERILDILQGQSVDVTAAAIDYVIRHHAINAELDGGDDCCVAWLAQIRAAVDAAEEKLGEYIEQDAKRVAESHEHADDAIPYLNKAAA